MVTRTKIKLAAIGTLAVLIVGGLTVGGLVTLAQSVPPPMPVVGAVLDGPLTMAAPGPVSIGVLTGLSPAQVATLPIALRTKVKTELQADPDFRDLTEDFRTDLIRDWDQRIGVRVLDAGSGTVMLTMSAEPASDRQKAGSLVTAIYLRRCQTDKENQSIDLRRLYADELQRAENDMRTIDKRVAEIRRTNQLVELPPSTAVRDALIQARIDLIRANAQDATQHTDELGRQIKTLEKVVQDLTALQAEETAKAVDLALKLAELQRIESERSLPVAERDAASRKINEIRIADITKGPVRLIATAE